MKLRIVLPALCILFSITASAQDKIYRHNGKVVEAKVIEIGASEIKYREFNNPDGPIYILETDRIKKIVYENGKEDRFKDNIKDPERYSDQADKAIKINFFSPLYGYFEVAYEKSLGFGRSYEFSLGIIGAGKSSVLEYSDGTLDEVKRDPFGFFISAGYKFGKLPDFIIFGKTRASHLMQGTYVRPAIYAGHYKENKIIYKADYTYEVGKQNVTFGAVQLEFGKQWVLGDKVTLDFYWGLGYGFDNKKSSYEDYLPGYYWEETEAFNYANARIGKTPGLSGTFGVRLGMLLGKKVK
jgi:hypothetical protein